MNVIRSYFAIFAVNIAAITILYALLPGFRDYLFREDGLIENLTAIIFFCAFLVSMYFFFMKGKRQKSLLVIAFIGLLGFLDEVSFGERHFRLNMPRYDGVKFDAVHDGLFWGYLKISSFFEIEPNRVWALSIIGLALLTAGGGRFRTQLKCWASTVRHNQRQLLDLTFFLLLASAMLVDLDIIDNRYLYYTEEVFEMFAGVALVFCALIRVNDGAELDTGNLMVLQKISDGLAVFTACMMATWIRFESGFIPVIHDPPPPYSHYVFGSLLITVTVMLIMSRMNAHKKPFSANVFLAILAGLGTAIVIIFFSNTQPPPSRTVVGMLFILIPVCVVAERYVLYRIVIRKDFPSNDETGYGW